MFRTMPYVIEDSIVALCFSLILQSFELLKQDNPRRLILWASKNDTTTIILSASSVYKMVLFTKASSCSVKGVIVHVKRPCHTI